MSAYAASACEVSLLKIMDILPSRHPLLLSLFLLIDILSLRQSYLFFLHFLLLLLIICWQDMFLRKSIWDHWDLWTLECYQETPDTILPLAWNFWTLLIPLSLFSPLESSWRVIGKRTLVFISHFSKIMYVKTLLKNKFCCLIACRYFSGAIAPLWERECRERAENKKYLDLFYILAFCNISKTFMSLSIISISDRREIAKKSEGRIVQLFVIWLCFTILILWCSCWCQWCWYRSSKNRRHTFR